MLTFDERFWNEPSSSTGASQMSAKRLELNTDKTVQMWVGSGHSHSQQGCYLQLYNSAPTSLQSVVRCVFSEQRRRPISVSIDLWSCLSNCLSLCFSTLRSIWNAWRKVSKFVNNGQTCWKDDDDAWVQRRQRQRQRWEPRRQMQRRHQQWQQSTLVTRFLLYNWHIA